MCLGFLNHSSAITDYRDTGTLMISFNFLIITFTEMSD